MRAALLFAYILLSVFGVVFDEAGHGGGDDFVDDGAEFVSGAVEDVTVGDACRADKTDWIVGEVVGRDVAREEAHEGGID